MPEPARAHPARRPTPIGDAADRNHSQVATWLSRHPGISASAKGLYAYMLSYAWPPPKGTGLCTVTQRVMAEEMHMAPGTLGRCIDELIRFDLIRASRPSRRAAMQYAVAGLPARVGDAPGRTVASRFAGLYFAPSPSDSDVLSESISDSLTAASESISAPESVNFGARVRQGLDDSVSQFLDDHEVDETKVDVETEVEVEGERAATPPAARVVQKGFAGVDAIRVIAGGAERIDADEPKPKPRTPVTGEAAEMYAALQIPGGPIARATTENAKRRVTVAVKQLRGADPPATVAEIPRLLTAWPRLYPRARCTAMAIASNLDDIRAFLEEHADPADARAAALDAVYGPAG